MVFIVVGAGLSRTGTLTLKSALETLLDGPCYHTFDFVQKGTPVDVDHWAKTLEGRATSKDWREFLEGMGLCC